MSSVEKESPDGDRRGPLAMGSACHQCRKKKSKCDGVRPTCGPCANPFRRIAGDCTWDTKPFHGGRPKGRKSSGKRDHPLTTGGDLIYGDNLAGHRRRALKPPGGQPLTPEDGFTMPLSGGGMLDYEMDFGMPYSMGANGAEGLIGGMERGWRVEDERLSGMTFGRASADLPSVDIVEHVCNVFFDKVPLAPLMMSRSRFMVDLHRAPNHRQRPSTALLHAILAITARYLPDSLLHSHEYQPNASRYEGPLSSSDPAYSALSGTGRAYNPRGTAMQRFETFHRDRATEKSWASIAEGYEDMIDSSRAATIVTQLDYFNADTVRFFPGVSVAIRCLVALHCNETSNIPTSSWDRYSFRLMSPPRLPLDQAHRDRVWWVTWLMDKHTTFMGNWVPSIADYEVTVELPVSQEAYDYGEMLVGVQSLRSPDLFTHNPPIHQDGLCLMIKATLLHAQAGAYLRDYSRGPHSAPRYACQDQLWSLLGKIDQFYQIFPEQFKHPQLGVKLDRHVLAAIWMAHGAQAILGEPIIEEAWTSDLAVSTLTAVRTGLKLLHEVMGSSFDLTLLHNVVCLVWYNFARILARFLDAALASGDLTSASVFSNEMQIVKDGLEAYATRHDYGRRMANRLEALMRARANKEKVGDAQLIWVEGTGAISDSGRDLSVSISPASLNV